MITQRQLEIYNNLLSYTQDGESFYYVDQPWDGVTYRIFAYRLASYTDFMKPDALEGRGIMFELDSNGQPVRLACRPMHKFFNLNENPSTMNLNLAEDNLAMIMDKADGSLISTWVDHNGKLQLKSKTSLYSDQVRMAWNVLHAEKPFPYHWWGNKDYSLKIVLESVAETGTATVNMEYVGPDNRIVLGYTEPQLRVLNTRQLDSGEYDLSMQYWDQHPFFGYASGSHDGKLNVDEIKGSQGYEGVVVVLESGEWFKLKTDWYAALHHTKDSINSKRRLFECVINEATDDLKAMFAEDPVAMALIGEMEALVIPKFNHFVKQVEDFFASNKDLDRKSYAIKGQNVFVDDIRPVFSLVMSKYLGREVNYKEWAVKHRELFGVKDERVNVTADTKE